MHVIIIREKTSRFIAAVLGPFEKASDAYFEAEAIEVTLNLQYHCCASSVDDPKSDLSTLCPVPQRVG